VFNLLIIGRRKKKKHLLGACERSRSQFPTPTLVKDFSKLHIEIEIDSLFLCSFSLSWGSRSSQLIFPTQFVGKTNDSLLKVIERPFIGFYQCNERTIPSYPICLSCQIERKLDPKEPFFTTLGDGGEGRFTYNLFVESK